MSSGTYICGMGAYVPSRVLTNEDIASFVATDNEWIVTRTGIHERRLVSDGETNTDMALAASKNALHDAGLSATAVTHIIYASCTVESASPSGACILANKLGIRAVFALDINAACSGFVYGLSLADSIVRASPAATLLVVGVDALSTRINWTDRTTCILFGDAAGAAIVRGRQDTCAALPAVLVGVMASADTAHCDLIRFTNGEGGGYTMGDVVGPEFFIQMQGREVFKHAVRGMVALCGELLQQHGITVADVDLFVPHQANLRIIEAVGEKLGIPVDRVFVNLDTKGNTSAASIPLALVEAAAQGRIRKGMFVLVVAFGAGLTSGVALVRY